MRPMASTAVASMQNIAAPDSASELIWVKCQSLAEPSIAEYWHIGATMMRLGNVRSRNWIGENRTLMRGIRRERKRLPVTLVPVAPITSSLPALGIAKFADPDIDNPIAAISQMWKS